MGSELQTRKTGVGQRGGAIIAAALAALGPVSARAEAPGAPALVAGMLDGGTFDLRAERGHAMVLHLWASWCPPCRAEMPLLDHFARTHPVRVVGLSFDSRRDIARVRVLMHPLAFPTALVALARQNGFGADASLPQTLVIDATGHIAARFDERHPLTEAALASAVASAR